MTRLALRGTAPQLEAHGTYVPFVQLFGRDTDAPHAECRDYLDFDHGDHRDRGELCPHDSQHTIHCPACDQRCRLEPTAIPTFSAAGAR